MVVIGVGRVRLLVSVGMVMRVVYVVVVGEVCVRDCGGSASGSGGFYA